MPRDRFITGSLENRDCHCTLCDTKITYELSLKSHCDGLRHLEGIKFFNKMPTDAPPKRQPGDSPPTICIIGGRSMQLEGSYERRERLYELKVSMLIKNFILYALVEGNQLLCALISRSLIFAEAFVRIMLNEKSLIQKNDSSIPSQEYQHQNPGLR